MSETEEIDVKSALRSIISEMEAAVGARRLTELGELGRRALDAANEAAYVYERGVIQQIGEMVNAAASKSKTRENDQLIADAERLIEEVQSDAPNLLPKARGLADAIENLVIVAGDIDHAVNCLPHTRR